MYKLLVCFPSYTYLYTYLAWGKPVLQYGIV